VLQGDGVELGMDQHGRPIFTAREKSVLAIRRCAGHGRPGHRLMRSRPAGSLAPAHPPAGLETRGCAAQTSRPDTPGERAAAAASAKSAAPRPTLVVARICGHPSTKCAPPSRTAHRW